jgi:hypothetical protein
VDVVDIESTRARLSLYASVAAAVRRLSGLEWRPRQGYRVLARTQMARMERMVRAPADVELHVLRLDAKQGVAIVEWTDHAGRVRQAEIPQIALARHARRRWGDKA